MDKDIEAIIAYYKESKPHKTLISRDSIFRLREAFYSCKLSGILTDKTFIEYLEEETIRRNTKNNFTKTYKELEETLEGNNSYIGDYWIEELNKVCTVFHNRQPKIEKGHKEYPYLFIDGGNVFISALDKEQWGKVTKFKCTL